VSVRGLAWALVAIAAFALGCAASRQPEIARVSIPPRVNTLAAPAMYAALCAQCHGAQATGYAADHAPSLVNPTFLESASDFYLHLSIEQGRPGTSMAAYAKGASDFATTATIRSIWSAHAFGEVRTSNIGISRTRSSTAAKRLSAAMTGFGRCPMR